MFSFGGNPLCILSTLFVLVLFARVILSWFPIRSDSPLVPVARFLTVVTEPVLAPFRRVIPPVGGLDLSVLVVALLVEVIIRPLLCSF